MTDSITEAMLAPAVEAPLQGQIDQYELIRELDGGGIGFVALAHDTVSGVDVSMMPVPAWVAGDENAMLLFRRWFSRAARLHHPGIASPLLLHKAEAVEIRSAALERQCPPGTILTVAAFTPGITLAQLLHRAPDGTLPLATVLTIAGQLAAALDYAQTHGLPHGCLRPENILIDGADGGGVSVRMVNFGLEAVLLQALVESPAASVADMEATPCNRTYFAPEEWCDEFGAAASDQYALAAIVYELLTGSAPFSSAFAIGDALVSRNAVLTIPPEIPEALPAPVRLALAKALAKKAEGRFASCTEFVGALDGKIAVKSVEAEAAAPGGAPAAGRSNRAACGALATLALLGFAAAAGAWFWQEKRSHSLKRLVSEQRAALARTAAERETLQRKAAEDAQARATAERRAAEHLSARNAADARVKRMAEENRRLTEEAEARLTRLLDEAGRAAAENLQKEKRRLEEAFARQETVRTNLLVKRHADECLKLSAALQAAAERERKVSDALRKFLAAKKAATSAAPAPVTAAPAPERAAPAPAPVSPGPEPTRDDGKPKQGDVKTLALADGVAIELVYCAPGEYVYGADGVPARMARGFWIGKYEVTQRQWESVMGENPSYFKGEDLPVDTVSWDDCRRFVAKINARFSCDARLPTEREWEYACRASTKTAYSWGQALNGDKANCDGTFPVGTPEKGPYLQKTVPVGSYAPNPWGLYCMHGNVREWCADTYDSTRRVLRGGSWYHSPANCRSASRDGSDPASRYSNFGFRLCCSEGGAAK